MINMILSAWERALMRSVLAPQKHEQKRDRVVKHFVEI